MRTKNRCLIIVGLLVFTAIPAAAGLNLGPVELVQANGAAIEVPGYSVPSFDFWNGDDLKDLVVGEGGGGVVAGKVRVYLNVGTGSDPLFTDYFYAQSDDSDLVIPATGCLGAFPRLVTSEKCKHRDLLVGMAGGKLTLFVNVGTSDVPTFDSGTALQVGVSGFKEDIDVGTRATPTIVDWNNDGVKDLVVGAMDGRIHIYINEGTNAFPDFISVSYAEEDTGDLVVPTFRSSPHVLDLDDDGRKDLLTGNTRGQLLLYHNVGSDANPFFSGYTTVLSDGDTIDLPDDARSRPFVCDWTGDGYPDVLVGGSDGQVRLYQGVPPSGLPPEGDPPRSYDVKLLAPYPNPFNPHVTIPFELTEPQRVELSIYNLTGRKVTTLADRWYPAGAHRVVWDGRDEVGLRLPSGFYFVRLKAGEVRETGKIVLLR